MSLAKKHNFKIALLGEPMVGKTSLIQRYVEGMFTEGYKSTIGVDFLVKETKLKDERGTTQYHVILQIWDIAGQSLFTSYQNLYLANTHGAFLVFDLERIETLKRLNYWYNALRKASSLAKVFIIGNKLDLIEDKKPSPLEKLRKEADKFAKSINAGGYIFTSAKTGENVEQAFTQLTMDILSLR